MSNLPTQLYTTLTHPDTMRSLLAGFFRDRKDQAVALLQQSGVAISNTAPAKVVQTAWLKAIKDSASFRASAASALTGYVTTVKSKFKSNNFVGNERMKYYNDVTDVFGGQIDPGSSSVTVNVDQANAAIDASDDSPDAVATPFAPLSPIGVANTGSVIPGSISNNPNAVSSTVKPPSSSSSSSSGSFWDSLGSIFSPKVIQTGITTGLQAYSTNLTAKANQTSEQNALAIEQAKLAQSQLAAQNPTGLSTTWIVVLALLGVGGLIAAAAIIAHKKKK